VLFLGDDWAEAHHDVELQDGQGLVLVRARLPEGVVGVARLHALIADHLPDDGDAADVLVGIEIDHGPWVNALIAAGYTVYALNPVQVARYRERHGTAGAKSDRGDAHVLAEIVRVDREHHRAVAGDSEIAEQVKVLARVHQSLIWSRQRQGNTLRSMLREYHPGALVAFGEDLTGREARAVLAVAPSPAAGRALTVSRLTALLKRAGRTRYLQATAERIHAALRTEQLSARPGIERAYVASVTALIAVLDVTVVQIQAMEAEVSAGFGQHPDAEIYLSQPGLGAILAARVLAEFGDDPTRYLDTRSRKNYSGMAPITRASGTKRSVLARHVRNKRLADALYQQAFSAISASPGARAYYDRHRARGATHHQALRTLANRLVGILHGCLNHHQHYDETTAWAHQTTTTTAAA
jgi:transposase